MKMENGNKTKRTIQLKLIKSKISAFRLKESALFIINVILFIAKIRNFLKRLRLIFEEVNS